MTSQSGERSQHFGAIERKHGQPIAFWLDRLAELGVAKYPEQIAYLREEHGFSRTHANAVVMYHRGSTTSKRFDGPEQYFAGLEPDKATTARRIFACITERHPELELVMAWNQPMLRIDGQYVIGLSASTHHLTLNPFSIDVLHAVLPRLSGYTVNKYTFQVPVDWAVDAHLLNDMVAARLVELGHNA